MQFLKETVEFTTLYHHTEGNTHLLMDKRLMLVMGQDVNKRYLAYVA